MSVSTAYVNQILPKDASRVSIPGHVIQVQTGSLDSQATSSTSYVNTGLYVNITPQSISNKIIIKVFLGGLYFPQPGMRVRVIRNSTTVVGQNNQEVYMYGNTISGSGLQRQLGYYMIWDFPASTSAQRYEVQVYSTGGGGIEICNGSSFSTIEATEISV